MLLADHALLAASVVVHSLAEQHQYPARDLIVGLLQRASIDAN
jgi:hypothetical protein